jgi:hypothetical protein
MTPDQLRDECIDEVAVLEEEFVAISGGTLDDTYKAARDRRRTDYLAALKAAQDNPEAISKLDRRYRSDRRRMFAILLKRSGMQRTALCFSGGGIRSATFSLGIIQWLGQRGFLKQFNYLSTVSGGGYAGSWLTAWSHRHPDGVEGVERDLIDHDPDAVVRLREYSNYLAPKFGLLTADTWTLATTYLRNLLTNWLAFLPSLAAVVLIPQLALVVTLRDYGPSDATRIVMLISGALFTWAAAIMAHNVPGEWGAGEAGPSRTKARPWNVRNETDFLIWCFVPFVAAGLLSTLAWKVSRSGDLTAPIDWFPDPWVNWFATGALFHVIAMLPVFVRVLRQAGQEMERNPLLRPDRPNPFRNLESFKSFGRHSLKTAGQMKGLNDSIYFIAGVGILCGGVGGLLVAVAIIAWQRIGVHMTVVPPDLLFVIAAPAALWFAILLAGVLFVAMISHISTDYEREWYARAGAWMLIAIVSWLAISSIALLGPSLLRTIWMSSYAWPMVAAAALSGLLSVLGGGSSTAGQTPRQMTKVQAALNAVPALAAPLFLAVVFALLAVFATALMAPWSEPRVASAFDTFDVLDGTPVSVVVILMGLLVGFAAIIDMQVDLNVFSLHALYRDRLIRAYLAASRIKRTPNGFTGIDPNDNLPMAQLRPGSFGQYDVPRLVAWVRLHMGVAGIATLHADSATPVAQDAARQLVQRWLLARDSPWLARVRRPSASLEIEPGDERALLQAWNALLASPALCAASGVAGDVDPVRANREYLERMLWDPAAKRRGSKTSARPLFPVINTALNLVRGDELAWQQRKAESFVFTPLHAGASSVGYRRTAWHGDGQVQYYAGEAGVTVGTAMTISGAAANPNMGYHSSPAVTFLLTLFNGRLGAWLGNPADSRHAVRRSPRRMLPRILAEAFGQTNRKSKYVNLSDGGHFENLGVYEMVRRRCHLILLVDAGQDGDYHFQDLGNAIAKVRVDFGVPIEFPERPGIHGRAEGPSQYSAVGRIRYSAAGPYEDGWLLYIKPALGAHTPVDVSAYAARATAFPHEPTSNQFFTERQFESYRMLGWHAIQSAAARLPDTTRLTLQHLRAAFDAKGSSAADKKDAVAMRSPAGLAKRLARTEPAGVTGRTSGSAPVL